VPVPGAKSNPTGPFPPWSIAVRNRESEKLLPSLCRLTARALGRQLWTAHATDQKLVRHEGWYAAIAQSYAARARRNRWVFADPAIAQIWASPAAQTPQDALAACESTPGRARGGRAPVRRADHQAGFAACATGAETPYTPVCRGMERPRRADGLRGGCPCQQRGRGDGEDAALIEGPRLARRPRQATNSSLRCVALTWRRADLSQT